MTTADQQMRSAAVWDKGFLLLAVLGVGVRLLLEALRDWVASIEGSA